VSRTARPLLGQAHAHRAAVDLAALVVHVAHFDELLEIVADIGALVVASGLQLPRRDLVIADIEQQKRLHRVDVEHADPFEFVLDHVEQQAMQTLHHRQRVEIPGQEAGLVRREGRMQTHDGLRNTWLATETRRKIKKFR
jgi:hypothetical protein